MSNVEKGFLGGSIILKRLCFLDGLRGWGAVFVVLYHVFCDALPFDRAVGDHLRLLLPFNGPFAVLVFFLVSGFSLSVGYLAGGNRNSLVKIAVGRYPRLVIPIFIACSLVYVAMISGLLAPAADRIPPFNLNLNFHPTFSGLMTFSFFDVFFNYDPTLTYIGPLWTMRFELAGSFLVLATIFAARDFPGRLLIFAVATAGIVFLARDSAWGMLALFPIGTIFADCFNRGLFDRVPKWAGIALILVGVGAPFSPELETWYLIPVIALIAGCLSVPQVRASLSGGFSRRLGKISFPVYLIHGPVIWFIGEPMMRHFGHSLAQRVTIDFVVLPLCFLAGYAFIPVNEMAVRFSRWNGERAVRLLPPRPLRLTPDAMGG